MIDTARAIAQQSAVVTKLANRLAAECTDKRMRTVSLCIVTPLLEYSSSSGLRTKASQCDVVLRNELGLRENIVRPSGIHLFGYGNT